MRREPYQIRMSTQDIATIRAAAASAGVGHTTFMRRASMLVARIVLRLRPSSVSFASEFARAMAEAAAADDREDGRRYDGGGGVDP